MGYPTHPNGTPLGWGYHDIIARAIHQATEAGADPRTATDMVLAELAGGGCDLISGGTVAKIGERFA